jgi:hypothetical protein
MQKDFFDVLGETATQWKERGEKSFFFGEEVKNFTRDELLMVIGSLGDTLEFEKKRINEFIKL